VRPEVTETTALGAAYLAGLATGVWASADDVAAQWREGARFEPSMPESERSERVASWRRALECARGWAA
jgi:glycerol kinase